MRAGGWRVLACVGACVWACVGACVLAGCGDVVLNAADFQVRPIAAVAARDKTLTLKEGMVWCQDTSAQRCLRLPPGRYAIESEDADFRYFRAPEAIDFRIFDRGGKLADQRLIAGGIALRKTFSLMLPAEVYTDGETADRKILVHKLGHNFAELENRTWVRDFSD